MTNLPIIVCFVLGIGLLIVEALMPGFGIAGFSGIALEVVALVLTWQQHGTMATLGMLLIVLSVLAIAISTSLHSLTKGKLSKSSIVNSHTESTDAGYRSAEDMQVFLGREGTATTALRPTGLGEFDGIRLNVVSEGDFIENGTKIRVTQIEGSRIVVKKVERQRSFRGRKRSGGGSCGTWEGAKRNEAADKHSVGAADAGWHGAGGRNAGRGARRLVRAERGRDDGVPDAPGGRHVLL